VPTHEPYVALCGPQRPACRAGFPFLLYTTTPVFATRLLHQNRVKLRAMFHCILMQKKAAKPPTLAR
jgi:hypothetical protein